MLVLNFYSSPHTNSLLSNNKSLRTLCDIQKDKLIWLHIFNLEQGGSDYYFGASSWCGRLESLRQACFNQATQ